MKHVNYDAKTNEILGYYGDEIHESIPEPNIKISDDEWQEAIYMGANFIERGKLIKKQRKADEREKRLAQLEADITDCKDDIRHALIIGNASVLENLRNEYKSLLAEHEKLEQDEQE